MTILLAASFKPFFIAASYHAMLDNRISRVRHGRRL
jgi:hypothetical protein